MKKRQKEDNNSVLKTVLVAAGGVLAGVLTTIGIQKLCCDDESPTKKKKEKNGDLHEEEKLPENPTTEPVPGYENNEDILTCPIGQTPMNDPYITKCGHTFEKKNIFFWLEKQHTCPMCAKPLTEMDVFCNYALKSVIEEKKTAK